MTQETLKNYSDETLRKIRDNLKLLKKRTTRQDAAIKLIDAHFTGSNSKK